MTAAGRHAAPVGHDPATTPSRLRTAWETAHGRLPDRARSHRYVQVLGDIGPVRRRVDLEPMPETAPVKEPAPVVTPVPSRPLEPAR